MASCSSSLTETQSFSNLKGLASQTTANLENIDVYIEQNILDHETERKVNHSTETQKIEEVLQEWTSFLEKLDSFCNGINSKCPLVGIEAKCETKTKSETVNTEEIGISIWPSDFQAEGRDDGVFVDSIIQEETCVPSSDKSESFDESLEISDLQNEETERQYTEQGTQTNVLTVHHKVGKEDILSEFHISEISEDLGGCWEKLGSHLHIKSTKIDNINRDYSSSAERVQQLLLAWTRQEGKQATLPKLKTALKRIKRKDVADRLSKLEKSCKIPVVEKSVSTNPITGLNVNLSLQLNGKDKVHICEDSSSGEEYVLVKLHHNISDHWDSKLVEAKQYLDEMIHCVEEEQREEHLERQKSIDVIASKVQELQRQIEQRRQLENDNNLPRLGLVVEQEKCIEMLFKNHLRLLGFSDQGQNIEILNHILALQNELRKCENELFDQFKSLKQCVTSECNKDEVQKIQMLQQRQSIRVKQAAGIARFISCLIEEQSKGQKSKYHKSAKTRKRLGTDSMLYNRKKNHARESGIRNRSKTDPNLQRPTLHSSISSPINVTQKEVLLDRDDLDDTANDGSSRLI